ncbi:DUF4270 domain-containing protein [Pedobacter sp. Hv1]|uniref:DUF4270 domain-containing protein n=1 Tax=Pedobacter sp. Hv1 TaxID=1740090 RepID=UPI0006D8B56D|nr:DUF4270 domain-containing protein [Pedobacter sp. Hv1]KQB99308.1 hypothetical protein AQF98_17185 [Pedobacter sp. Hv1]
MKFIKLDLLTLLISLFLFASCEKSATIGLEVDPTSALQGDLADTLTVSSRTVLDEDAATVGLTRYPLGAITDPIFGKTEAALALAVNTPDVANYTFGTNAVIDSAVLSLSFGGEFYGDSTSNYSIDVRQLSSNLRERTSYLSSAQYATNSTLIGNRTGKVYPTTPFKITDIVVGKPDTLKTVSPQIRIKLDNSFIQNNIVALSEATLKTNSRFADAFKGLYVQVNKVGSTGTGGLMFFDFASTKSNLTLYYKKQSTATTTEKDTVATNFPIDNNFGPVAASIKHDYTGTPIATQLANPTQQYGVTYLQPLIGVRNKISFPYLDKFMAAAGKIVVNKAELIIDLSSGTDAQPFNAAPRLALYRNDIAEKRKALADDDRSDFRYPTDASYTFGGTFNAVKKQYVFNVSLYVQDLLNGKTKDYGTFLVPVATAETSGFAPTLTSGARSVIGAFKKNPATGDNIMKLKIYYTKTN